jgi:predicted PurR-regulated permease PerM
VRFSLSLSLSLLVLYFRTFRFGAMTLALNFVPVFGLMFGLTSMAGAALWASDLEKREKGEAVPSPPGEEEQVIEM